MKRTITYLLALQICAACATLKTQDVNRRSWELSTVMKIQPGKTSKSEVVAILGEPNEKRSLSTAKEKFDWWSYTEKGGEPIDRVSVDFPLNSAVAVAVTWGVNEGEPEQSLEATEAHFPSAHFASHPVPDVNPHASENATYYQDDHLGILIRFSKTQQRVESISWMTPQELIRRTSINNIEYPEFCLQEHCTKSSPAIQRALSGE